MLSSAVARVVGTLAPLTRGMTLGVRGCCIDADGRIFLVKHSYTPGWYMPGGGIERKETALDAVTRELVEEGGIRVLEPPTLFGFYFNSRRARDHVVLYVVRHFDRPSPPRYPNREILEAAFFAPDALPADTTASTRRRIAEVLEGAVPDPIW